MTIQIHESITGRYESLVWQSEGKRVSDVSGWCDFFCSIVQPWSPILDKTSDWSRWKWQLLVSSGELRIYRRTSEQLGFCSLVQLSAASDPQTYKDPRAASKRVIKIIKKRKASRPHPSLWVQKTVVSCNPSHFRANTHFLPMVLHSKHNWLHLHGLLRESRQSD